MKLPFLITLIMIALCSSAFAYDPKEGTGLKLPRFASLKSDNVYIRTGPSMDYPIKWIYKKSGLPVEIVQEFDAWRKIKDADGETGWAHKLLLSGRRTAIVKANGTVTAYDDETKAAASFQLEPGVVVQVDECGTASCMIEKAPYNGWIPKKDLWGVYGDEVFD